MQLDKKNREIEKMEQTLFDVEQKSNRFENDLDELTSQFSLLNMEYKFVREACDVYEVKIPRLEKELEIKTVTLDEMSIDYDAIKLKAAMLGKDLEITSSALSATMK